MQAASTYVNWDFTNTWGLSPAYNAAYPYLLWQPTNPVIVTASLPDATQGMAYTETLEAGGDVAPYTWREASGTLPVDLTLSTWGVISGTPISTGTTSVIVTVTDALGHTAQQTLRLTIGTPSTPPIGTPSTPPSGTPSTPPAPVWTLPVLKPEAVTIDDIPSTVIGNLGYNPQSAIQDGMSMGYVEERAAVQAGAIFSGEGTESSYLSAILDGSGVGKSSHVSEVQHGQFAALYQHLGIIPTWTDNVVRIPQGVTALLKTGASTLAIENYLVQLDGVSWQGNVKVVT